MQANLASRPIAGCCRLADLQADLMSIYSESFIATSMTVSPECWFAAQRRYVHKTCFRENRIDTTVVCPVMWTYDICAFDTDTYYD